jgi:uncharacterized membrane protein SpoIIM required for sporulation
VNVDAFVAARRSRWSELEARAATLTAGRLRRLEPTDLERLANLYRHAAGDLAIARRDFPDHPVTEYLNGLCGRVHVLLHRGREPRVQGGLQFFLTGAPRLFRANVGYFAAALACLLAGVLAGWLAYDLRPDLRTLLVPDSLFDQMAQGAPSVTMPQPLLAAPSIFVHNIEVAAVVFVAGILLGLPTAYLLLLNGWTLGTLGAAVHGGGYDFAFWSLIAAHGVLELSIIVIAGAAGLRLGDAILRPGLRRRVDSIAAAGHDVVGLFLATAVLLVVAGCLEAFVSPSGLPGGLKVGIGLAVGATFYAWLLLAGRTPAATPSLRLEAVGASGGSPG